MKVGLALAGGGVRGAAHIGVIKALIENNIEIGYIGGTSIGSIVAAFFAMGYTTDEMYKLFKYFSKDILKVEPKYYWENVRVTKNLMGYGILSGESIESGMNECARLKGYKNIKDIKIPIVIPTVDIKDSKEYVFTNQEYSTKFSDKRYINDITIGKAVRASSSYPAMFAPTIYKNHKFVDGGVIDNLPTQEVRKLGAEKVIAVRFSSTNSSDPKNIFEVALKSVDLLFDQRTEKEIANSDFALTLNLPEASVFNIKKIDYCYTKGYITTIKNINKIKEIIKK